jgi:excinuclease ABC subunit B
MYGDTITASMQLTIDETARRRTKQLLYNEAHGITPTQIVKTLRQSSLRQGDIPSDIKELQRADVTFNGTSSTFDMAADPIVERMTRPQLEKSIANTTKLMKEAAKNLDFLQAAQYRDEIIRLQKELELKN